MKNHLWVICLVVIIPLGLALSTASSDASGSTAPGEWTPTGSMITPRMGHTATLLTDGLVLVVGGGVNDVPPYLASAELYDPATGTWRTTASMMVDRAGHTASLLADGRILVVGGDGSPAACASAEIYTPDTETWNATSALNDCRAFHTATLLPDGNVLAAGGMDTSGILSSAELYDPAAGTWTLTGSMSETRHEHTATLLADGRVLVAGGYDASGVRLASAELYNPATGAWSTAGDMSQGRWWHTATLLPNGHVIVVGGWGPMNEFLGAELFDPAAPPGSAWSPAGTMTNRRADHAAVLLPGGRVLAAGGYMDIGSGQTGPGFTVEIYDAATGAWSPTGSMAVPRIFHTATTLQDGRVLVAGGDTGAEVTASAELYSLPSFVYLPLVFYSGE